MDSLSLIKEELIKQKEIIESRSGVVAVANTNPSPAEITAGINSIPTVDLSQSTATEADVKSGKTFYSGDAILKTGTATINQAELDCLFMAPLGEDIYDEEIYYTFPSYVKQTRKYLFNENVNSATITFNDDLEVIEEYTFYKAKNFKFQNFNELTKLNKLSGYCFAEGSSEGIDFSGFPNSITSIGAYSFYYVVPSNQDIVLPPTLSFLGQSAFMSKTRTIQNSLDVSGLLYTKLPTYCFYYNVFNCDLVIPSSVTTIGSYFNYNGCFKSLTFHSNIKTLEEYCFGAGTSNPNSYYFLESVTFEGQTPPTIKTQPFARQNVTNGLKIYVPDESVDAYKAVTNLSNYYSSCILPMSEKE